MKLSLQLSLAAISLSLMAGTASKADTILHYTFSSDTYYDFSGGSSNSVTGSFDYNATNYTPSNVVYNRGGDVFNTGIVGSNTELYFGDTNSADYDVYEFTNSLANGGTDTITGGYHPAIVVYVGGSVSAANSVPEPASWALMLMGVGGMGAAMRTRRRADRNYVHPWLGRSTKGASQRLDQGQRSLSEPI